MSIEPIGQDWGGSVDAFDQALADAVADNLTPPPRLKVSEWADKHRRLSPEASAEPGPWNTSRAEYQRGMMDAIYEPMVHTVVVMSSAQVGKTELELNISGYYVHHDPAPMLAVYPTHELAEAFSKDRFAPMIRDCPELSERVQDGRTTKGSASTILHKVFPGGHISMVGSNAPSGLAGRPVRIVLLDEVDRYPASAGKEGDPVNLARKRTKTFWNRKIILVSTPTVKDVSRIEAAYEASDRRQFWVPCPKCGTHQVLKWGQVKWPAGDTASAYYECEAHDIDTGEVCGHHWSDVDRWAAIKLGEWRARKPTAGVAGFHLNAIYSPWTVLGELAEEFVEAKKSPETLKTFVNTELGETWEEKGDRVDDNVIESRKEAMGPNVSSEVVVVTAGVDVQDDRLEVEFTGWGRDEESWSLDHVVLYGDPSTKALWDSLDETLRRGFPHETQGEMKLHAGCIDTGGHFTQMAYAFCKPRQARNIWAIKGQGGPGRAIWPQRASTKNKAKVPLYMVGVDAAKESFYSRLQIDEPGPGYCHFPDDRDDEYFRQLNAEETVTKYSKGFPYKEWKLKSGHKRNEALDLRVYSYAALQGLIARGLQLNRRASLLGVPKRVPKPVEPAPSSATPTPTVPTSVAATKKRKAVKRRRGRRSSLMR